LTSLKALVKVVELRIRLSRSLVPLLITKIRNGRPWFGFLWSKLRSAAGACNRRCHQMIDYSPIIEFWKLGANGPAVPRQSFAMIPSRFFC
jgi:hypothetical protein